MNSKLTVIFIAGSCVLLLTSVFPKSSSVGTMAGVKIELSFPLRTYIVGQSIFAEIWVINIQTDSAFIPNPYFPAMLSFITGSGVNLTDQWIHVRQGRRLETVVLMPSETLLITVNIQPWTCPHPESLDSKAGLHLGVNVIHTTLNNELLSNESAIEIDAPTGEDLNAHALFRAAMSRQSSKESWPTGHDELVHLLNVYPNSYLRVEALREMIRYAVWSGNKVDAIADSRQLLSEYPDHVHSDVAIDQLRSLLSASDFSVFLTDLISRYPKSRAAIRASNELKKESVDD